MGSSLYSEKNEEKKLFFEGQNMIVAQGRNFVAQKIFSLAETGNDLRDYKIFIYNKTKSL